VLDYELLDFGNCLKLERFGPNIIARPEKTALKLPNIDSDLWTLDARCVNKGQKSYQWHFEDSFKEPWRCTWNELSFELRATISNNIGIFPEQAANWQWISEHISAPCKVLNLFGYTGAASLVAAQQGASVCHVDASKSAVSWARKNQLLSGLESAPIRWINDDALSFVLREQRRSSFYDALILDPPAFGKSSAGVFKFVDNIMPLLQACQKILVNKPQFILLNCYATGLNPEQAQDILRSVFPSLNISCGELRLSTTQGRALSCSVFARATSI